MQLIYVAIVLDEDIQAALPCTHGNKHGHHITLKYGDIDSLPEFIGSDIPFVTEQYFCDEKGEAISVRIMGKDAASYTESAGQRTHLTLSCAEGTSPVYSNELIKNGQGEEMPSLLMQVKVGAFVSNDDGTTEWLFHK